MRITSTANPVVRRVQSLESARGRREHGLFLAEGVRLVTEALQGGGPADTVLYDPDALSKTPSGSSLLAQIPRWADRSYEVDERVLRAASQTEHPGGVLAAVPLPFLGDLRPQVRGIGVVLDGVADPGNAGTILRAADAFGASFVYTTGPSVDLFSPKVVRAGMGAHFRVALASHVAWDALLTALESLPLIGTAAGEGHALTAFEWPHSGALIIGSEARGLSDAARQAVTSYVHIPIRGEVESLNAAMAASIMLFCAFTATRSQP